MRVEDMKLGCIGLSSVSNSTVLVTRRLGIGSQIVFAISQTLVISRYAYPLELLLQLPTLVLLPHANIHAAAEQPIPE